LKRLLGVESRWEYAWVLKVPMGNRMELSPNSGRRG